MRVFQTCILAKTPSLEEKDINSPMYVQSGSWCSRELLKIGDGSQHGLERPMGGAPSSTGVNGVLTPILKFSNPNFNVCKLQCIYEAAR